MRTGEEIRDRALALLNYTDNKGQLRSDLYADLYTRSLGLVNQIYGDIWYSFYQDAFEELGSLSDTIRLPGRVIDDVMPYGVAMLMAQTVGDGDNQSLYATLYNRKRAGMTKSDRRVDVWSGREKREWL
ncbi:MAG: hypothetical protein IJU16_05385 [Clostridia bacterium]|nr:hypothetical protein [Clostridia bacterium]